MGVDELPADRIAGTHNSRIYGWTPIPLISWQQAAMWQQFQQQLREKNWKDWTSTDLAVGNSAFALTVASDAMSPTFNEGAILIIDPDVAAKTATM